MLHVVSYLKVLYFLRFYCNYSFFCSYHILPLPINTHKYNKLTAKSQKPIYSRIIYDEIRAMKPPGRFLKQDPKTKLWSDIGEKKALDKTRQALREGAPELLKVMEGGEDSNEGGGKMKKGGQNNIAQQQQLQEEIPLRMSNLTDSMFSATSLGGFSLGDVFNSFNAGVNVGASGGGNNDGSGGIPGQIGGGASMDNMFGPGVGADDILAAAAQIQAQQQAIQQQAIQQQQILRQQQQQQNNNQQQPQNMANLQAQLQFLKSMELQGSNRSLGSNMDMGGNNNSNQQQQQRNNSGMTIGTYDLNASSSSAMSNSDISNFLSSMNNMANNSNNPGMGRGQQQMGNNNNSMNPNAIMYQQQMLQQAMLNQMNNNPNYSNNNYQGGYDGHSSASTLPAGNLSSSNNRTGNNNNNNNTFGNNANVTSPSFGAINNQFQGGYQEKSFNTTVPLKSPGNEGGPMPSMTEEEGNPSMLDDMDTKSPGDSGATGDGSTGQRRPGNMRGGASGDVNSSFTRAQRIGLKNSFTQKRRPNRKLQNAEMHNSLKNSLMSIESLSLEDLDVDVFDMKANETASPGNAPGSSNTDRHGDGPHDMSEVSLPTFDQQDQGNV